MSKRRWMPLAGFLTMLSAAPAGACDLCAVYSAVEAQGHAKGFYGAVAEQFTRYDQLRDQGHRIDDDAGQFLDSSVTQLIAGYGFSDDWSVQLALPYLHRSFKRPQHAGVETGSESGLGDLTLTADYLAYRHQTEASTLLLHALAGLKLPTGNSDRLGEELHEHAKHEVEGATPNGIHGHDLALGSGSTDFLFGFGALGRVRHWLATADLQYALRRRGDFDYRFGDDLQWSVGLGRYLVLEDDATLSLSLLVDGEYKWYDDLAGERLDDTHSGTVMAGPGLQWTYQGRYSLDARGLVPVQAFNSEVQTTAAWRIRMALGYRF